MGICKSKRAFSHVDKFERYTSGCTAKQVQPNQAFLGSAGFTKPKITPIREIMRGMDVRAEHKNTTLLLQIRLESNAAEIHFF